MGTFFRVSFLVFIVVQRIRTQFIGGPPTFDLNQRRQFSILQRQGPQLSLPPPQGQRFNTIYRNFQNEPPPPPPPAQQQFLHTPQQIFPPFNTFPPPPQNTIPSFVEPPQFNFVPQNQHHQQFPAPPPPPPPPHPHFQTNNFQQFNNGSQFVVPPGPGNDLNKIVQYHTQTRYTPNFVVTSSTVKPPPLDQQQQILFQPKPVGGDFQTEKQRQQLKELLEKQAIIEKHNQFVEKQYKKALDKVRADHQQFVEKQREEKKHLQSRLNKLSAQNAIRFQTGPRYIYPEEEILFKKAIIERYPHLNYTSTSSSSTTSTTSKPSTLNHITFLPTVIPSANTVRSIQTLDDLHHLQQQYKTQQINKGDLIAQLRHAISQNRTKTDEIVLPNGDRVEIIKTNDPKLAPAGAAPIRPGSELEKYVISKTVGTPPKDLLPAGIGTNFELLKTGASGGLEQVNSAGLLNQKKVTFVLLEEQNDGTLKVQGVKNNGGDKDKSNSVDIESILKKIKNGEIKLPARGSSTTTEVPVTTPVKEVIAGITILPNSFSTVVPNPIIKNNTTDYNFGSSTTERFLLPSDDSTQISGTRSPRVPTIDASSNVPFVSSSTTTDRSRIEDEVQTELPEVLKGNGLYAMAKFLRQSGLDTILNETGPYTVFIPTDKAFRSLLVQLGGPEKAEEKFKENPRLLSGLLLHHVVPGSFPVSSLQDEMTGVSLAGTQLRVNQYNMHDLEWNDIKVTTINGAKILDAMRDIEIPQGIAHAIDRVMFPLPVGNIVQTLQSDRERRFTNLVRAIFTSGLAEMLQGPKTYTLFAPTDKAFNEELSKTVTDKQLARDLIMRHLVDGALYTNGMRYYQIKDSLLENHQLILRTSVGKVKVNNISLATQNIPTTNGVIHAIDTIL